MWRAWDDAAERTLAETWRTASPFPHIVIDDASDDLPALFEILDEESVDPYEGDILSFEATAPEPRTAELRELRNSFASAFAPHLSRITGKTVTRVDMRAYAYRAGHFLLPHSDHQQGLARVLAYAFYLPSPEPPVGGELELYACDLAADGTLARTTSAKLISPAANRLVVFDVSDVSLHQVREVLGGMRLSLAGWFYA